MKKIIVPLVIAATLLPVCALAQWNSESVQRFRLSDGSVIKHELYDGVLRRFDREGRQVASAKLPKAVLIARHTTVVVGKGETRLLVVHSDDDMHFPPRHRVMLLDALSLRTSAEFPLGDCEFLDIQPLPEQVSLVCQQSSDPAGKNKKKTLAFVTLDLNRAQVTRWFDLGGERRGKWVGPMFFGYRDDALALRVEREGCDSAQAADTGPPSLATVDASEQPQHIIVVARTRGTTAGDVWFVGPGAADAPRRVATLTTKPTKARLCGGVLQVSGGH